MHNREARKGAIVFNSLSTLRQKRRCKKETYLLLSPSTVENAYSSHDHSFSSRYHRQIARTRHNHTAFQTFLKDRNHTFVIGGNDVHLVRQPNFPEFPPFFFSHVHFFFLLLLSGQCPYMSVHRADMFGRLSNCLCVCMTMSVCLSIYA